MGGRLHVIGKSGQARAAAASAGAGRRLELRHGDRVPTRAKERAAQDFELRETMRCVRRVSRGFGDCATSRTRTQFRKRIILSVPPTHPTSPFHSLAVRCCMASERSCSLGPPPAPPPPPSQCWAGPETPCRMAGVLSHACTREKQAPGERTSK